MDRKVPLLCTGLVLLGIFAITPVASAQLGGGGFTIRSVDRDEPAIEGFSGMNPAISTPGGPSTPPETEKDLTLDAGTITGSMPFAERGSPRLETSSLRTLADGSTVVMGYYGSRIATGGQVTTQKDVWKGTNASVGPDGALYSISGHSTTAQVERTTIEGVTTIVNGELPEGQQMLFPSANKIFVVSKSFYSNHFTVSEVSNGTTRVIHTFDAAPIMWARSSSFPYTMLDDGTLIGLSQDRSQFMYFKPDGTVDSLSVSSLGFPADESPLPFGMGQLDGSVAYTSTRDDSAGTIKLVRPDGKIRTITIKNAGVYRVGTNAAGDITATIKRTNEYATAVKITSAGKITPIAQLGD